MRGDARTRDHSPQHVLDFRSSSPGAQGGQVLDVLHWLLRAQRADLQGQVFHTGDG